jgi:hypothetical protein
MICPPGLQSESRGERNISGKTGGGVGRRSARMKGVVLHKLGSTLGLRWGMSRGVSTGHEAGPRVLGVDVLHEMALEDHAVEAGEHGDDQAGKLGDEARQPLHGVPLRVGASANPILAGGRRLCSSYLVAVMPR